jgi:hypothetical protein
LKKRLALEARGVSLRRRLSEEQDACIRVALDAMAGSREAMTVGSLWDHLMASQVGRLLAEEAMNDKQLSQVLRKRLFRVRVVV